MRLLKIGNRYLAPERRKIAATLRQEGYSLRAIGRFLGVSKTQIAKDIVEATGDICTREALRKRLRANDATYRVAHREKMRAYAAVYRSTYQEKMKKYHARYYATHRDEALERRAQYAATHKQKIKEANARYYAAHAARERDRSRRWQAAHPERVQERKAARRAMLAVSPVNTLRAAQWRAIKAHYGHRCVYCGKKPKHLTQDHITPLIKGGAHTVSNIVPACRSCNSRKQAGPPLRPVQPLLLCL